MLSKIEKLIRAYRLRVGTIEKELRGLTKDSDYVARIMLLKEQGMYIDVLNDLRDIIE